MRRITMIVVCLAAAVMPACLSAQSAASDSMYLSIDVNLLVFDRREAADILGAWAEENGGYFTHKSDELVVLRVPDEAAEDFRRTAENMSEAVVNYGRTNVDIRQELLRSASILESREEILARNTELLDVSDVEGTLEIEREIRRLMSEIDAAQGRLRKLSNDAVMSSIRVTLSFRSQSVPDYRPSSFAWINGVDFYDFLAGYDRADALRVSGDRVALPEGFAPVKDRRSVSGISPEGVRFRMVRLDNYPRQEDEFWIDALENDFEGRGFIRMPDDFASGESFGNDGFQSLLWGIPVGEADYLYLTALRTVDDKIEVIEMTGPAEIMAEYVR